MFTSVFGGSPVLTSQVAYLAYNITTNLTLTWPQDSETNAIARLMDFTAGLGLSVTLPDATEVSTGQDAVFRNLGSNPFIVVNASGMTVANVAVGQVIYLYLTDNSILAGNWRSVIFGVGSSMLDAASLQGLGITALGNTLAQGHSTIKFTASQTLTTDQRASLMVWEGGAGTLTLPSTVAVGNTFFFEVRNSGSGSLQIVPAASEFIDDITSIRMAPGDSAFLHASPPSTWFTVGRGRSAQFNFTQLIKTVTGGTTILTSTEAANVVQKYIGNLLSDQIVVLPAVVQVYYISNSTTGAHTLTFQSPTPSATVTIPSNQNSILFCDGTNVINTSTTLAGFASLVLAQGAATSPALTFSGNLNTGLFQPTTNTIAVTCAGVEVARFNAANTQSFVPITLPADATQPFQATTNQQMDVAIAASMNTGQLANYMPIAGGIFTGNISAPAIYSNGVTLSAGNVVATGSVTAKTISTSGTAVFAVDGGSFDASLTASLYAQGSGALGGAVMVFNRAGTFSIKMGLDSSNGFGIGGGSEGAGVYRVVWDSAGSQITRGNVTAYSDLRWKEKITQITGAVEKVKLLQGFTYTDVETQQRRIGVAAQHLQIDFPEAVHEDNNGRLAVAYGNAALALLVEVTREFDERLRAIEARL